MKQAHGSYQFSTFSIIYGLENAIPKYVNQANWNKVDCRPTVLKKRKSSQAEKREPHDAPPNEYVCHFFMKRSRFIWMGQCTQLRNESPE